MKNNEGNTRLKLPTLALGAEYLVMGYLMRRNIMVYRAPNNNEGYDLIAINPISKTQKYLRIQVKSRYQIDNDNGIPIKDIHFDSFDYLIIVYQNIGFYFTNKQVVNNIDSIQPIVFYTLPSEIVKNNHYKSKRFEKFTPKGIDMEGFKNELGFEKIAVELQIEYPNKHN